ncbi:GNAT family N-acetyltransferase [Streptomyces sp. NPDC001407]|uniref:GNAT family N-acetyltransferase n=1 Tax=Streptomyces sp. NPDC001407 TaxID=3364573 RepID=UPI0036A56410
MARGCLDATVLTDQLAQLEAYYDAVPRTGARAEDFGPLTLFVQEGRGSWPYYARPTLGRPGSVGPGDVSRVRARQRELRVPESFEWVAETTPSLRTAAEATGLVVHEHPLMVLGPDVPSPVTAEGVTVRTVGPDDPVLADALAVAHLAFTEPGTAIGTTGSAQLAEQARALTEDGSVARLAARLRSGTSILVAALRDGTVLCSGQHQPVGPVSEIVGVGTLPTARRRGLALAVTTALVADARHRRGAQTVFLSAGDDDVARVYTRAGFRRVATALIAGPADRT